MNPDELAAAIEEYFVDYPLTVQRRHKPARPGRLVSEDAIQAAHFISCRVKSSDVDEIEMNLLSEDGERFILKIPESYIVPSRPEDEGRSDAKINDRAHLIAEYLIVRVAETICRHSPQEIDGRFLSDL